jgi:hypothetical protein
MTEETPPQMADVICLLLFAVEPSDSALAGWGIGRRAADGLQAIGDRGRLRKRVPRWTSMAPESAR